jgi:hypothetical protein
VTLTWTAPTENTNGSALTDLAGYTIHYGTQSQVYTSTINIENAGLTAYVISNLPAGTYFFVLTDFTNDGISSADSPQVSATVR